MKSEVLVEEGGMTLVRHSIPVGFDSAPLYRGLPDDLCPCEHHGYVTAGQITVGPTGRGQLELTDDGMGTPFPADFPTIAAGMTISVGPAIGVVPPASA